MFRVDHTSDLCAAALFLLLRTATSLRSIIGTELWQDLNSRYRSTSVKHRERVGLTTLSLRNTAFCGSRIFFQTEIFVIFLIDHYTYNEERSSEAAMGGKARNAPFAC
jgi:hypothetical protein